MHPTVVTMLAAEHHAELLRNAESRRRVAALTRHDRPSTLAGLAANLTGALHLHLRRPAAATATGTAELCCA